MGSYLTLVFCTPMDLPKMIIHMMRLVFYIVSRLYVSSRLYTCKGLPYIYNYEVTAGYSRLRQVTVSYGRLPQVMAGYSRLPYCSNLL